MLQKRLIIQALIFHLAVVFGPSIREYDFGSFWSSCHASDVDPMSLINPPKKRKKKRQVSSEDRERDAELEVRSYLNEPTEPLSQEPLSWWKVNSFKYPGLAKLARRLLSSPPSSVESERLFSIGETSTRLSGTD